MKDLTPYPIPQGAFSEPNISGRSQGSQVNGVSEPERQQELNRPQRYQEFQRSRAPIFCHAREEGSRCTRPLNPPRMLEE